MTFFDIKITSCFFDMHKTQQEKEKIRKEIAQRKKRLRPEELTLLSQEVMMTLEITGVFVDAKNILIYNNLSDEVETLSFIEKWNGQKNFYLPAVVDNDLVFRKFHAHTDFLPSSLGVQEPRGENLVDYSMIDLVIVPGIAFDRKKNRLGRGKGYYDRFLKNISVPTIGICFEFQLFDNIPADEKDVKMNMIVSENDFIW